MKKLYQGLYKVAARRSFRDTRPIKKLRKGNVLQLTLINSKIWLEWGYENDTFGCSSI